jgi:hypothetical protein
MLSVLVGHWVYSLSSAPQGGLKTMPERWKIEAAQELIVELALDWS